MITIYNASRDVYSSLAKKDVLEKVTIKGLTSSKHEVYDLFLKDGYDFYTSYDHILIVSSSRKIMVRISADEFSEVTYS